MISKEYWSYENHNQFYMRTMFGEVKKNKNVKIYVDIWHFQVEKGSLCEILFLKTLALEQQNNDLL